MIDKTEGRIQQECYVWFHNTFPDLRGLLCYNLGNSKNRIDGALNKSKGLQPGRSDFTLYLDGEAYFIEMKDDAGVLSPDQRRWRLLVTRRKFTYQVCRSLEEFKSIINNIINGD